MSDMREISEPLKSPGGSGRRAGFLLQQSPLGPSIIGPRLAILLRNTARIWTVVALAGFGASTYLRGVPFRETSGSWQEPAQLGLLAVVALGWLVAWKLEWLGASLILIGAAGLGILATLQFEPITAFIPFVILLIPAVLYWLSWQRQQPTYVLITLALVMAIAITGSGLAAQRVYNDYFGPTHPASKTAIAPAKMVNWAWAGAASADSILIKAQLLVEPTSTRLAVSRQPDLAAPSYTAGTLASDSDSGVYLYQVNGLQPDTEYYYAVEVDGELDSARQGRFRTFPAGPGSFSFAFSSCARTGSDGQVFDAIRATDPLFMINGGDFYYGNITENDPAAFYADLTETLTEPAQSALYRSTAIAYIWDDHDYGPNDGDKTSPSREASLTAYTSFVPHYPLETATADGPIYQAFTVGRVRFILTDLRSDRDPGSMPDGPDKSMMGAEQKAWFKQQLLDAKDTYPVIFWVSSVPWINEPADGADDWGGYTYERTELANFIAENDIEGLIVLGGDAHMIAFDDGTNSNYSLTPGMGFPVFHAAALDRHGTVKGGPYSDGTYPGGGHFGEITVTDDGGDQISVTMNGMTWDGQTLLTHTVTFDAPFAIDPWTEIFGQVASGYFTPE